MWDLVQVVISYEQNTEIDTMICKMTERNGIGIYYPAPGRYRERGIVFARFLSFFLSFFVFLSARLRENGWTDLHEIFKEGVE